MIYIPKIIYFNELETNKLWDNTTIYNYIVSYISDLDKNHVINKYKYHYLDSKLTSTSKKKIQIEFDIFTSIHKKSTLLSFFTYKRINHVSINNLKILSSEPKSKDQIIYRDQADNYVDLIDMICHKDELIYKGTIYIKN